MELVTNSLGCFHDVMINIEVQDCINPIINQKNHPSPNNALLTLQVMPLVFSCPAFYA